MSRLDLDARMDPLTVRFLSPVVLVAALFLATSGLGACSAITSSSADAGSGDADGSGAGSLDPLDAETLDADAADTEEPDLPDDPSSLDSAPEDTTEDDTEPDGVDDAAPDAFDAQPDDVRDDPVEDPPSDPAVDSPPDAPIGPIGVEAPAEPDRDGRVEHIVVTVRTATSRNADTNSPEQICVGPSLCWRLDTPDVDDRELGNTEVYHFEGLDEARDAVDRMTLRAVSDDEDDDRWTPACVEYSVNGRPTYCQDEIDGHLGTGGSAGERREWTDPAGPVLSCDTCWPSTLSHGPMIGTPTPDSVRVWGRLHAGRLVGLRLGTERDLRDAPVVDWTWAAPEDDFTFTLAGGSLLPATEYFYRLEVDGVPQGPVRPIHTAPAADAEVPMRLAFGSCSREVDQPIFTAIAADRPDLFFFVGDNNYANSRHAAALRWHYRRFRALGPRSGLLAVTPTMSSWDDHDFLANNSNATCPGRTEALDAFTEYWANPSYGLDDLPGVFFRYRWGAVEFFSLDCRMYRPDVGDSGRRCDPVRESPPISAGPLGLEQEAWALDALASSDATFKIVSCGSRFTPSGSTDSWRSFPEARTRLWRGISDREIEGVVLLSGDIHRSELRWIDEGPGYRFPEITSSPLATGPSSCGSGAVSCYDDGPSYVVIDVDPTLEDPTLVATIRDEAGSEMARWTLRRSELE